MNPARLALSRAVNRALANGSEPLIERRPCRLDGFVTQDSEGFYAESLCGSVKIHISPATVARKYSAESCPSIYYE